MVFTSPHLINCRTCFFLIRVGANIGISTNDFRTNALALIPRRSASRCIALCIGAGNGTANIFGGRSYMRGLPPLFFFGIILPPVVWFCFIITHATRLNKGLL
jgi:hypothetical protein